MTLLTATNLRLGALLRRVRALVRVDQGGRDHRLPRHRRRLPARRGGGDSPGLSNLTAHGGFAPNGAATILSGVVIVIFAFVGAEIVTIAAAEADEPERAVARRPTRSSCASWPSTCSRSS